MGRACQLGSLRGGIHGKQKRDHTKHRGPKMRSNSFSFHQTSDERRVMGVRGLHLREEHADNKRGLKGSTVSILPLFLEIIPDHSSSYLCRSKFCIFQCPLRFYYTLLSSWIRQKSVFVFWLFIKGLYFYIQVLNPAFAAHFFSCMYTHACKQCFLELPQRPGTPTSEQVSNYNIIAYMTQKNSNSRDLL